MSWDQTWRMQARRVKLPELTQKASSVAEGYQGVTVEVDKEADDCITFFFSVPASEEELATLEVSLYAMGDNTHILSLEADASDNNTHWDDASQIAEDLAEALGAQPLDL